jgi:hypothetical protein
VPRAIAGALPWLAGACHADRQIVDARRSRSDEPPMASPAIDEYDRWIKAIRVRVENGRITGEAPPGLPEGDLDLCVDDAGDEMSDDELARLDQALARGFDSIHAGRFRAAADVIADLRRR